ncbi:hypothetical protein ABVT39_013986 [Epinephelus coioides]
MSCHPVQRKHVLGIRNSYGLFYHASCRPRYHFINEPLAWLKAQRFCRESYTDLATIFDVEDMNRLVNSAQDSTGGFTGMAWIGLHDNLTSWRWSFSDSNYYGDNYYGDNYYGDNYYGDNYYGDNEGDYKNWDFGQPDNFGGNQMCVTMRSGGVWDDSQCFLRNPFICYDGTTGTAQRFIFVEQEMNWTDAQLYCRKRYTDLASVRDEKENEEIQRLAQNRSVWIGFYRTREWSDKSNSTYRYWKNGQPDNVAGQQNCTVTDLGDAGLWLDERCGRELVFICYEDQDQTLQKSTLSSTTAVTRNKITPTTEESSGDGTSNEEFFSTTTTVTTNRITPTERISGTKIPSSPQPSGPDTEKTTSIPDQTLQKSTLSTTTTVTRNKILTTDEESSGDETSNENVFSTTTTLTPNRITPTDKNSSAKITSSVQPSSPDMDKTTSVPDKTFQKSTLPTTTVTRNKMTPTNEESSGDGTSNEEVFSTTTAVTPNSITTTEKNSSTKFTSSVQPSSPDMEKTTSIPDQTPQVPSPSTTTVIPNDRSTTEIQPSTGHLSTEITSTGQSSTKEVDQTRAVSNQTPQVPSPSTTTTTTMTPNTRTTTETKSTTGHFGTEITSVGQPSTTEVDQTRAITNQTPQVPSPSTTTTTTTTTVTPNTRTTTETKSTTGHFGTEITSVGQPSTTEVDQTRPITNQTPQVPSPSTTTVIPNNRSTTEIQPSTGHLSTEITLTGQSSTKEVDQTRAVSNQTPQVPSPSTTTTTTTTTVTPNTRTTTETKSTTGHFGTEITSVGQPSTTEVDQTRPITNQTPQVPSPSTTTVIPNDRSTTEIQPSTGHLSTEITSTGQSSTKEVDQTRAVSNQTPQVPSPSTTTTTTTTVTPNTRTTTETKSTTGHFGTEITSVGQPSTTEVDQTRAITNQTPQVPSPSTTTTTVTPNTRTTTETKSTTGHFGTEITSVGQPSTTEVDQTRAITNQTPQVPSPSTTTTTTTTTVTPNTRTTTETKSTTGHFGTEITSVGQPSTTEVDQTRAITNQTPQVPSPSTTTTTTTTVTPNTRTTTETKSTTGHFGTEITSVGQPSTTEVDQTRAITNQTPQVPSPSTTTTTTTVTPNTRTTTETKSTTGHFGTEITSVGQPSTTEVDQTRAITNQTPQVPSPSTTTTTTTTVTPNTRTTTETKSTTGHFGTEITSVGQPSTTEVDQTRAITNQTPQVPSPSTTTTTTTVTPNTRTTTETKSTTGHFGTEITSVGQPSTTEVDQTRAITNQTPQVPSPSTTTVIPNDRSTTEIQPSTGHLSTEITSTGQSSTKEVDQTRAVSMTPDKRTTTEIKSTTAHASAETTSFGQPSTSHADQTRPITAQHVVALRLKLTSQTPLTEDDIEELVLVQFRNLLIEMGLPTSIKVGVKSTEIMSNKQTETDG